MTYSWADGYSVTVAVNQKERPTHIHWLGKSHLIECIVDYWVVDDDWWVDRIWRLYFLVATHSGLVLAIFRDLLTNTWYVEQRYD